MLECAGLQFSFLAILTTSLSVCAVGPFVLFVYCTTYIAVESRRVFRYLARSLQRRIRWCDSLSWPRYVIPSCSQTYNLSPHWSVLPSQIIPLLQSAVWPVFLVLLLLCAGVSRTGSVQCRVLYFDSSLDWLHIHISLCSFSGIWRISGSDYISTQHARCAPCISRGGL
jgi:hypothetical protein